VKILIRKANTDDAFVINPMWLNQEKQYDLLDYVSELRQQAKWDAERCQRAQCAIAE
jgi:hypothetical protein